jgi:protein-disulfide isomerase
MFKLRSITPLLIAAVVVISAVSGYRGASAGERSGQDNHDIVGQTELGQVLDWAEAGITIPYPSDWQLIGDENFDFVLLGPSAEGTSAFTIIALQQSDLFSSLREDMEEIAGGSDDLVELSFGDVEALRFDTEDETQHSILVGFSPAPDRIAVLFFSAPIATWDETGLVFDDVLAAIEVVPLELDHETFNEQLQQSFVDDGTLIIGDPDAPVLIVEFLDYSCPHCSSYRHSVNRLIQDYVMTGRVRLNLSLLTFVGHEFSVTAANAQYCGAELGIGWDVHEFLFNEYDELGAQEAYTNEHLLEALSEAELDVDMDAFETCLTEASFDDVLDNSATWATELGVSGTPSMLFGANEDDLGFMTNDTGETITRTILLFTYDYIDGLTTETE